MALVIQYHARIPLNPLPNFPVGDSNSKITSTKILHDTSHPVSCNNPPELYTDSNVLLKKNYVLQKKLITTPLNQLIIIAIPNYKSNELLLTSYMDNMIY